MICFVCGQLNRLPNIQNEVRMVVYRLSYVLGTFSISARPFVHCHALTLKKRYCLADWQSGSIGHSVIICTSISRGSIAAALEALNMLRAPNVSSSLQQAIVYTLRYDGLHEKPRAYAPWSVITFLLSVIGCIFNTTGRAPAVSHLRQLAIDVSREQCATSHVTRLASALFPLCFESTL